MPHSLRRTSDAGNGVANVRKPDQFHLAGADLTAITARGCRSAATTISVWEHGNHEGRCIARGRNATSDRGRPDRQARTARGAHPHSRRGRLPLRPALHRRLLSLPLAGGPRPRKRRCRGTGGIGSAHRAGGRPCHHLPVCLLRSLRILSDGAHEPVRQSRHQARRVRRTSALPSRRPDAAVYQSVVLR